MRSILRSLFLVTCTLISFIGYSQTNVSGAISANTTWTLAGSPYNVVGDISIVAGSTLTISEGVTVNFTGNYQILVRGAIKSNGSLANPIKFNGFAGGSESTKYMILFRSTNLKNSPMTYTEFTGPQYAIQVSNETENQQDQVKNSDTLSISHSKLTNSGLLTKGFDPTFSKAKTTLVLIKNSIVNTSNFKGEIRSEPIELINSTITNSNFTSTTNHLGFYLSNSEIKDGLFQIGFHGAVEITNKSKVINSRFIPHQIAGESNYLKLDRSYILNTSIEMESCNVEIDHCIIAYNEDYQGNTSITTGIGRVLNSHLIGNKKNTGIERSSSAYSYRRPLKIINTTISGFNTPINIKNWTNGNGIDSVIITGNNISGLKGAYLVNSSSTDIMASENYWGTANSEDIDKLITDFNDNVSLGTVTYAPYLTSNNAAAPISPPTNVVKYRQGNDLILTWSANTEADLVGYKLYWGSPTGYSYAHNEALGNVLTYTIPNGDLATEYALTAYDTDTTGIEDMIAGHESWFSTVQAPVVNLSLSDTLITEGETKYIIATLDYPTPTPTIITLSTQGAANDDYTWAGNTITIAAGALSDSVAITHPQNTITELTKELTIQITAATKVSIGAANAVKLHFIDDDPPSVTFTLSNSSIIENGGLSTMTATLSAPTSNDVLINFTTEGEAQIDKDYLIEYEGKNTVSTLAGSGIAGYKNGIGQQATFDQLYDITIDSIGNLFVTAGKVRKITPVGVVNTTEHQPTFLHGLQGIVIDQNGNLYVTGYNSIQKITTQGFVSTLAGGNFGSDDGSGTSASFRYPHGLKIDKNGNIIVADFSNHKIRRVTPNGVVTTIAGTGAQGSTDGNRNLATFNSPINLTTDKNGNIFVADLGNNKIRKISSDGIVSTITSNSRPRGVISDRFGNLFISSENRILRITNNGEVLPFAGTGESGDEDGSLSTATFRNISGLVIDQFGNMYITDSQTYKIKKIQLGPQIRIKAGQTTGTLVIKGIEDLLDENDETVIFNPSVFNATLANSEQLTLTIQDNTSPPAVTLSLSDSILIENGGSIDLIAQLNTLSAKDVTLRFSASGTATVEDYSLSSTTLVIPAGQLSSKITISGIDDTIVEVLKSLTLTVDSISNATIGKPSITCHIVSEDKPIVNVALSKTSFTELEQSTFTATLSAPTATDVTIEFKIAGSASQNEDYSIQPSIEKIDLQSVFSGGSPVDFVFGNDRIILAYPLSIRSVFNDQFSIIAGHAWERGSTDGMGGGARFNYLRGIALDKAGNLYIADTENHKIRKMTPAGLVNTLAGNGAPGATDGVSTSASFNYPTHVVVDSDNNVYVTDRENYKIRKITPAGLVSTLAGNGSHGNQDGMGSFASFGSLAGLAVDKNGNIYVTDNHRIRKVTPGGVVSTFAGSENPGNSDGPWYSGQFKNPGDITIDSLGNLYVADPGNRSIRKISPSGGIKTLLTMPNNISISQVAIDQEGHLYMSYYDQNYQSNIVKIRTSEQIVIPAGQTTGSFTIKGIDDIIDEEEETIILTTHSVKNATLSGNEQLKLTIQDTTPPPAVTLSLSDSILIENGGTIDLTARLNTLSAKDVTLRFSASGTATVEDYTLSSTTLVIPAGQLTAKITILGKDDAIVEVLESLTLTVDSISNATIERPSITCYIESEDKPILNLTMSKSSFSELEQSILTATLSAPTSKDVTIEFKLGGSASQNEDYSIQPSIEKISIQTVYNDNNTWHLLFGKDNSVYLTYYASIKSSRGFSNDFSIIAGNPFEVGSTDGTGTAARFINPAGIALDKEGNLYIADQNNHKIRKMTPAGLVSTLAGNGAPGATDGASTSASFYYPTHVAVDNDKNVYVTEPGLYKIRKITPAGLVSTLAGNGSNGNQDGIGSSASFGSLSGITVDRNGNVYVADNNKIRKVTPGGVVSTFAGSGISGSSDGPWHSGEFESNMDITIDSLGNLFVADPGNHSIRKISPSGEIKTLLTMPNNIYINQVAIDQEGYLFMSYRNQNGQRNIAKIQTSEQIVIPAGQTTSSFTIKGKEDTIDEVNETITLTIPAVSNATLSGTSPLSITLLDNRITLTKVQNAPFPAVSSGAVAWGDFDRDGDQDLAIMGRSDLEGNITRIYRNNAGTFVNTNQNLERLRSGDIKWVDVNKDGYIDLAVSGVNANGERKTNLYLNENGSAFVIAPEFNVVQVSSSKMAWGDLDNDGDLDLAIAGLDPNNTPVFYLYEKVDGQLTYNRITDFYGSGFTDGDIKIADFDLDGDNDIIYKGGLLRNSYSNTGLASFASYLNGLSLEVTKLDSTTNYLSVLANGDINGTPQFESSQSVLAVNGSIPKLKNGDIASGDFNNDGRVDLLFTGEDNVGSSRTELYTQGTNGRFLQSTIPLSGLRASTANWVDYDVDGDLDLFMMGIEAGVQRTFLYKADVGMKVNRPPSPPTGLKFENLGNGFIRLSWDIPADDHSTYLGYNIRLGTTPGGSELSNTQSNLQTGARLITETAPIHTNSYLIQLSPGQYYWSVQAIDQGFLGSPFAPESSFALQYEWKAINQGGIVDRTIFASDKPIIGLLDIDDDQDLDMILGSSLDRTLYTFNGKAFVRKDGVLGYGGVENIAVGDINNDGRTDLVINSTNNQFLIHINQGNGTLPVVFSGSGLVKSKIKIVDFDNDGKTDILIAGLTSLFDNGQPKFYRYEFDPTPSNPYYFQFTDLSSQIVGLRDASYDFGDYDKDKDIDFIISGFDENSGLTTALYKNQTLPGSPLTLVRTTDNLVRVDNGTCDFVDYDGDGDLDILFTGRSPEGNVFEIYENRLTGNVSNWVNISIGLDPIRNAKIDLGDFDGDGYNDLLYTGFKDGIGKQTRLTQFNPLTKKYIESTFDLGNIIDAEVEFGDIDADGDLDMIIAGNDATNVYNRTFKAYLNVRNESARVTAQNFAENEGNERPTKGGNGQTSNAVANFTSNQPPVAPLPKTIRTITTSGQKQLEFSWHAATDDHTPTAGLTYNLRIGTSSTSNETLASNANTNGVRKVVAKGNTEHNTSWVLNNLPDGTYYWSVQALDASYIGSTFSTPQKFEIMNGNLITYQPPVVTDLTIRRAGPALAGTTIGQVIATDPENDPLTYSISAGNPQNWFSITTSGEIKINIIPPTYPDSLKLTVSVSDGVNTTQGTVTIFICSPTTVYQTLKSGNWNDLSVWSCGSIPSVINPVRVKQSHTITLPANITGLAKSLELEGQIQYNVNSRIQIGQ